MANPERGEFRLVAGAEAYTLRLTTNACCEVQDFSGVLFDEIQRLANKGSVVHLRYLLWASLRDQYPEMCTADEEGLRRVGNLIDRGGGLQGVKQQIRAFIALNADSGLAPKKESGGPRPLRAQVGTGVNSTLMH